jgi:hypothetical protein
MTKQEFNFEILIRGQMLAYHQDEIVDRFTGDGCYIMMHSAMEFPTYHYDGRIKVSLPDESRPDIGYFDTNSYEYAVKLLAYKLYVQSMKGNLIEMKERIKIYDQSINALKLAKVGILGDAQQIKLTYNELIKYRALLQVIADKCEYELKRIDRYDDIPNGDERSIKMAKAILMSLDGNFIIQEPNENDTVGTVKGKVE